MSKEKKTKLLMHNRSTFNALMSKAIPPQADGDAIDVPFMSMRC